MNKICCIYAIKDKRSDKVLYIGQTKNFKNRRKVHFSNTKYKRPMDQFMYNEGYDNFEMYVLEELPDDTTLEEMRNKEQFYIDKFDTFNNGLNKRRSGNISADWKEYCRELERTDKYKETNKIWYENNYKDWYLKNREKINEKRRINYQKKKQEKLNQAIL